MDECIICGASLITAYHNAGGEVDMEWALSEMVRRGKQVPGGACGNWGACGAGLSIGFDDPDAFTGTDEEVLPEFRRIRDEIHQKMQEFVTSILHP